MTISRCFPLSNEALILILCLSSLHYKVFGIFMGLSSSPKILQEALGGGLGVKPGMYKC